MPSLPSSSDSSSKDCRVGGGAPAPIGMVGGWSWAVALGRPAAGRAPPPVGARRMVGAGDIGAVPACRRGMVGAGGRGAAPVGEGGPLGTGGLTGGAIGTVAEGMAGGASAAFKVTRTVSFLRGTLDVCLDGDGG